MSEDYSNPEDGDLLEGRYANYFAVGQNALEFLLDFGQAYDENKKPQIHTRIITSPTYAKAFLKVLGDAVSAHEKNYSSADKNDE